MPYTDPDLLGILIDKKNESGLITEGSCSVDTIPTTASKFAPGCRLLLTTTGVMYYNTGTAASPVWDNQDAISRTEQTVGTQSVTATADGLTTGLITAPTTMETYVTVTSAAATNAVSLPAISASTVGQKIYLTVGANGYELLTAASSNNTINQVDSDGTNQLDVAANTTLVCTCVSSTGWICNQIAATTTTVVAPDND